MNFMKRSHHSSKIANGQVILDFRCVLGLTQLELAMKIDCSERLIRKMEKGERVSMKNLSSLFMHMPAYDIEVSLNDLIVSIRSPVEVAKHWFVERFLEHTIEADQKWFSDEIAFSEGSLLKLEVLAKLAREAQISIGDICHQSQMVCFNFHVDRSTAQLQVPCGLVWLSVENDKIVKVHVMFDSDFEWKEL